MVDAEKIKEDAVKGLEQCQSLLVETAGLKYLTIEITDLADRFERIYLEASKE